MKDLDITNQKNQQCKDKNLNQDSDLDDDENLLKNGTQANKAAWTNDEDVVLI